jgi:hypothetical protein
MTLLSADIIYGANETYVGDFAVVYDNALSVGPDSKNQTVDAFMSAGERLHELFTGIVSEITGEAVYDWDAFMSRPIVLDGKEDQLHFTSPEAEALPSAAKTTTESGYHFGKALVARIFEVSK